MKKIHAAAVAVLMCVFAIQVSHGQGRDARLKTRGYVNPQEIVSLDSTMRMDQALLVLGEMSKQYAGKLIIDLEKRRNPIGVYIVNQHWRDALEMILTRNGLTFEEEPDFIRIVVPGSMPTTEGARGEAPTEPPPTLANRDVKISAAFFNANLSKLQEYGISWNFFRSKAKEPKLDSYISAGINAGDTLAPVPPRPRGTFDRAFTVISTPPEFTFANLDALVKFFGSNQLGDVVTSPEVVVRNDHKGRIQVGKDLFVTTRDVAGNAISQLIPTGTIIEVTPTVYTQSDTDFIYLDLTIEQSDGELGTAGAAPTITRNQVRTHALVYDGEETVIGGLYTTSESEIREGIPFLKDLPPWFFGLRYLFGSESKQRSKQELIVLIKAELTKPVRRRFAERDIHEDIVKKKREEFQKEYDKK